MFAGVVAEAGTVDLVPDDICATMPGGGGMGAPGNCGPAVWSERVKRMKLRLCGNTSVIPFVFRSKMFFGWGQVASVRSIRIRFVPTV